MKYEFDETTVLHIVPWRFSNPLKEEATCVKDVISGIGAQ